MLLSPGSEQIAPLGSSAGRPAAASSRAARGPTMPTMRQRGADVVVREVVAGGSAGDRGRGGERAVRADEQRAARVEAQVPDAVDAPGAADGQGRVAEVGDERAVQALAVAAQLDNAEVRAVGETDALQADGDLAGHRPVVGHDRVAVAIVQRGAHGEAGLRHARGDRWVGGALHVTRHDEAPPAARRGGPPAALHSPGDGTGRLLS